MKNVSAIAATTLVIANHFRFHKILFCLLILMPIWGSAQQQVARDILALQNQRAAFRKIELVSYVTEDLSRNPDFSALKKGTLLKLNPSAITSLQNVNAPLISMTLPVAGRQSITLDLMEQDIFAEGFNVYTSDNPGQPLNYKGGKHYRGIVHGDQNSIVALSVFKNEINGMISTHAGNLVLGKIKGSSENLHILYNDADLEGTPGWECHTPDDGIGYTKEMLTSDPGSRDPGDCIRVYVEIDDTIVIAKDGVVNALNYVECIFNQVITLYANENITLSISEALVWTTPSPYGGNSISEMLQSYQQNTGSFNGDLSHLVSFKWWGWGIAAGHSGICNADPDQSKCFSGIYGSMAVLPFYSWSVKVVTHEMGHLIGSRHTHACVWNFNNTAIDGCAGNTEGGCPLPGIPSEGGTIMSYCQNVQGVGINFSLGFGPQPGNVIRNTVRTLGNCLSTACTPLADEYCWSDGESQANGWLQSVDVGSISNNSGNNGGYADFTAQSTTLSSGSTYTMTLTAGYPGPVAERIWGVWIDYNRDLDWDDPGENVAVDTSLSPAYLTFTIPASSPSATTRMRVIVRTVEGGANFRPCGSGGVKLEVEDYAVVVEAPGGPACNDGIQNGDESGVDCGGATCPVCPTCNDGVQNGDEEGVDCGGCCLTACPGTVLFGHFFETGWDGWTDGGADVARYSGNLSWEGNHSINLQDNSGVASSMTSPEVNLTGANSIQLTFYFYSHTLENGEDFFVQYYNGSTYTTVATLTAGYGGNFSNYSFWFASVTLSSTQVNFVSNAKFRIQCDASDNQDDIYIDAVTLTAYGDNPPCPDTDLDGVCDSDDVCPGMDDNLIGTACDDGNECTENDVYLGAPDCSCAGTPIPGCVPCNPQTASITPNPLTHIGTGASSTNILTLPAGSSDVVFTITGLNTKLTGGSNGRFIDRVNVWYDTGSGAQLFGTFNGDQVSSVNVSISGTVQSLWVTLEDGYDGNSQVTQSISFTQVTHCTTEALMQESEENAFSGIEMRNVESTTSNVAFEGYLTDRHSDYNIGAHPIEKLVIVYPNPVNDQLNISFDGDIQAIRIFGIDGKEVPIERIDRSNHVIDTGTLTCGIYFMQVQSNGVWYPTRFTKF